MTSQPQDKPRNANHGALKGSLATALMIPVVIAIAAGGYIATSDMGAGLPLLATGLVLLVFNIVLLKVLFSRLERRGEGGTGPPADAE